METLQKEARQAPQKPETRKAATREELMALGQEINARLGIVGESTMTAQELRASMVAHGVKPEDKGASRELLQMRYGSEYDPESDQ